MDRIQLSKELFRVARNHLRVSTAIFTTLTTLLLAWCSEADVAPTATNASDSPARTVNPAQALVKQAMRGEKWRQDDGRPGRGAALNL